MSHDHLPNVDTAHHVVKAKHLEEVRERERKSDKSGPVALIIGAGQNDLGTAARPKSSMAFQPLLSRAMNVQTKEQMRRIMPP